MLPHEQLHMLFSSSKISRSFCPCGTHLVFKAQFGPQSLSPMPRAQQGLSKHLLNALKER